MALNMYTASVPIFVRMLGNLNRWLDKAEQHAAANQFDAGNYLTTRLAPNMLPFTQQIQIACDGAKFCVARLAGVESPRFDDSERTVAELRQRIGATLAFIESVPASSIEGTEAKDVTIPRRDGPMTMSGEAYLTNFALPNLYFHLTTAYALLRHNGVPLGKMDYLGVLRT